MFGSSLRRAEVRQSGKARFYAELDAVVDHFSRGRSRFSLRTRGLPRRAGRNFNLRFASDNVHLVNLTWPSPTAERELANSATAPPGAFERRLRGRKTWLSIVGQAGPTHSG